MFSWVHFNFNHRKKNPYDLTSNIDRFVNNMDLMETRLKGKLSVLSRPDGSAIVCEGESVVLAAVYGPVEAKPQKVLIDKASVECFFRPKSGIPGVSDRFRENLIRNICETALLASLYPRTAILVNIQEMQNRGQLISSAINASCLACLDAGIDMKFLFGAVSCFLTRRDELTFIPPINEDDVKGMFVFVFNNTQEQVIASHTEGNFSIKQFKEVINMCREESKKVFTFYKTMLRKVE